MKILLLLMLLPAICWSQPKWEVVHCTVSEYPCTYRMKIPHGWLIYADRGVAYYPDEKHEWRI